MNLMLYASTETAFDSNGLGILREVLDDEVHEILNGQFELQFKYPVTGRLFQDLALDAYVTAAPNLLSQPQPFRIYRITKVRNGWVTVYARHICYELKRFACSEIEQTHVPLKEWFPALAGHIVPDCPFRFESDIAEDTWMEVAAPIQVWKLLGSDEGCLLDQIGGEYEFDRYRVIHRKQRGADRGVQIRHRKNLRDLTMDQTQGFRCNAFYPYCTGEDGTLYELPEKLVTIPEQNANEEMVVHVWDMGSAEKLQEDYPSKGDIYEIMRSSALLVLYDIWLFHGGYSTQPELSLKVDFVRLSETTEYKDRKLPDEIALGDTVYVLDPELGVEMSARVCEMRYQPSVDRIKSITLGSVKRSLAKTIVSKTTSWQSNPLP